MKTVEVQAKFQELTVDGYALEVTATETASIFKSAVSRAIGAVLKNPQLKRKRFTTVSLEVVAIKPEK